MYSFESFVESNFPFASDNAKQTARVLYLQLKNQKDLTSSDVPPLCTRYEDELADVRRSHDAKTTELFEIAFANDRRSDYVRN